jgi:hypothetical protein
MPLTGDNIRHIQAIGGGLGEGAGEACPIADGKEAGMAVQLEIGAGGTGGVIFALNATKESVMAGSAGADLIQMVKSLNNATQLAFGHTEAQVPGDGVQGGPGEDVLAWGGWYGCRQGIS